MDDETQIQPADQAPSEQYGEALIYDFSKFLTTLSVVGLGGVVTLTETADTGDIKIFNVAMISAALALAGIYAAATASSIANARFAGRPPPQNLRRRITLIMFLLAFGIGMFVVMWIDKLS